MSEITEKELHDLLEKIAFLECDIEWINDHLMNTNIDTQATRNFIEQKESPAAKRLLRICDLLDKESENIRLKEDNAELLEACKELATAEKEQRNVGVAWERLKEVMAKVESKP